MPKLRATPEQRELRKFNGFVLVNLKCRKLRQEDLADYLELPRESITCRLNEKVRWTLTDMFKVCEFFGETYTIGGEK